MNRMNQLHMSALLSSSLLTSSRLLLQRSSVTVPDTSLLDGPINFSPSVKQKLTDQDKSQLAKAEAKRQRKSMKLEAQSIGGKSE